jgi:hypothetical protein
MECKHN